MLQCPAHWNLGAGLRTKQQPQKCSFNPRCREVAWPSTTAGAGCWGSELGPQNQRSQRHRGSRPGSIHPADQGGAAEGHSGKFSLTRETQKELLGSHSLKTSLTLSTMRGGRAVLWGGLCFDTTSDTLERFWSRQARDSHAE